MYHILKYNKKLDYSIIMFEHLCKIWT